MNTVDVLMITYNAADYVAVTLPSLLDSCDENTRVWLWHNGDDERTLETTRSFADDPRVERFHHSRENVGLTDPTNWVWTEGSGDFVSKVDDDCLLPSTWIADLRAAHRSFDGFGAIGASICSTSSPPSLGRPSARPDFSPAMTGSATSKSP